MLGGAPVAQNASRKKAGHKGAATGAGLKNNKELLDQYKNRRVSWLVYLIVGIIIIPFAFLGINYYFQGIADDPVILEIDDYELSLSELNHAIQQRKLAIERQMPDWMPSDDEVRKAVLREIIRRQVIVNELARNQYMVPDIEVAYIIANTERFQSDGVFDRDIYLDHLASIQKTRSDFENELRERFLSMQMESAVKNSSFVLDHETSLYESLLTEEREIHYIELLYSDFYEMAEASTQDLVAMHEGQSERYMTKEKFKIEYISFRVTDYIDQQSASADEIKRYYDNHLVSFTKPERRTAAHILIDTKRRNQLEANNLARTVLKRLAAGEDFESLVSEYSEDRFTADQGGVLPALAAFEIENDDIADAVFSLVPGEVSQPIVSEFGVQIFKLLDVQEEEVESFEQLEKQIAYEVKYKKARSDYYDSLAEIDKLMYEVKTFAQLSATLEVLPKAEVTKLLVADDNQGIFAYPEVKRVVLDLAVNDRSGSRLVEVEPGHAMALRIEAYKRSELPPLSKIKDQVTEDVLQEKAVLAAKQLADSMYTDLTKGFFPSIDEVAEDYKRDIIDTGFINRVNQDLPAAFVEDVFKQFKMMTDPGGDTASSSHGIVDLPAEKKFIVYQIMDYRQGEIGEDLKELLARRPFKVSTQEYNAFLLEVAETADIQYHQERLSGES